MRVLFVSTYAGPGGGGAAIAAERLFDSIRAAGVDADFFCMFPGAGPSAERRIAAGGALRRFAWRAAFYVERNALYAQYRQRSNSSKWSFNILPNFIIPPPGKKYDIIHLHWIGDSFVNMRSLPAFAGGVPVVWTMHDSWPFTGGCHVPYDCKRYLKKCGNCPQLKSLVDNDLSRAIFNVKQKAYGELENMKIISPSRWLASCARASALFGGRDVRIVPNGIERGIFKPVRKSEARSLLGLDLPAGSKVVLFSGPAALNNPNKGFHFLAAALNRLHKSFDGFELVVAGDSGPGVSSAAAALECRVHYRGKIADHYEMALYNSAADLLVSPSMQENLPNTIIEAFACGTPAAAFAVGGTGDIIDDKVNGCLVKPFDVGELAGALEWALRDDARLAELGAAALEKYEREFTIEKMRSRYLELYEEILNGVGRAYKK